MSLSLFIEQLLNGCQLGVMLFLMSAGLTLVFGIMNLINLAHGSLFMFGAYIAASAFAASGNFFVGALAGIAGTIVIGFILEIALLRSFYKRSHLDQCLMTFGIILVANELVRIIWGPAIVRMPVPSSLSGTIELMQGLHYPAFRLVIIAVGIVAAIALYLLVVRTRGGTWVRAGASDRVMASALGIDVTRVFSVVFAAGAGLAGLAGLMSGPILAVQIGMGEPILILALVVIVVGGVGSIRGALIAALIIGIADTFGRVLLPAALGSMFIYMLMAAILAWRPQGLFPAHG